MTDYQQGKIYAIRSPNTDKYYIGSTATTLCKRFYFHKLQTNKSSSSEIIDFGDAYIELLQLYPCGSKIELNQREGEWQREMKADIVNKIFAHNTRNQEKEHKKEYYNENKIEIIEKARVYYQQHKAEIDNKSQVKHDCECGGKYTTSNKAIHIRTKLHQAHLKNN